MVKFVTVTTAIIVRAVAASSQEQQLRVVGAAFPVNMEFDH